MSSRSTRRKQPQGPIHALRPAVTLVLLMGLTWLTFRAVDPSFGDGRLAIFVGFVLLAASASGTVASALGLPRITGFIVIGILVGPSVLNLLPAPAVDELDLIDDFALALIAMLAGGELQVESLRPRAKTIAVATGVITGVVWVGVAAAVVAVSPLVPFLDDLSFSGVVAVALLIGVWAANSSPDLTVAVIEERRAEGAMAEVILGVTIVKDVVVIVLFTLTLALVTPLLDPTQPFSLEALGVLAQELGGALVLGSALGWVFSQYLGGKDTDARSPFATFIFAFVMIVLSRQLHMELLLMGVAAGFVIENLSTAGEKMIQGIRAVAVVIFAFFFTVAGARLDLGAVTEFWLVASVVILARGWLTRLGARRGMAWTGASSHVTGHAWKGLISQGGVSLGLILIIQERFEAIGDGVLALAMAVILGNILAGPILLARALSAEEPEAEGPGVEEPQAEGVT